MKIQCEYCGSFISDTDEKCPNCGATNVKLMRSAVGIPKTVEELKAFCEAHNMPPERMRFFIGEDYKGARAFGIYEESDGDFVVYKNKDDGSRAVRYRGKDEAYAVNEIYQKLKSEVQQRKKVAPVRSSPGGENKTRVGRGCLIGIVIFILLTALLYTCGKNIPDTGYYDYGGSEYYYTSGDWYGYDNALDTWYQTDVDSALSDNYGDYWQSSDYDYSYDSSDFNDSEYASSSSSSSGSYDSSNSGSDSSWDSDWDSGDWDSDYDSWDSGDTDWSSDW